MMSYKNINYYFFLIFFKLIIFYIVGFVVLDCLYDCGGIVIFFFFGIGKDCYLDEYYKIECKEIFILRKFVFVFLLFDFDVVSIIFFNLRIDYRNGLLEIFRWYGLVCVKILIILIGCFKDGNKIGEELIMNLIGSFFFIDD